MQTMGYARALPRPSDAAFNAMDFSGLNALHRGVQQRSGQTEAQNQEVARQFESVFIQQMLKSAREASGDNFLESDQTRMVRALHDEQLAGSLANPGLGLATIIMDQIQMLNASASPAGESGAALAQTATTAARQGPARSSSAQQGISGATGDRPYHADSISDLLEKLQRPGGMADTRPPSSDRSNPVVSPGLSEPAEQPPHVREFTSRMRPAARHAAQVTGIHEELILSQAALESGWGKREIRAEDGSTSYNVFGIKASANWKGKVVNVMTTEYVDGAPRKMVQPFRAYDSYEQAFADYGRLISNASRYSEVLTAPTPQEAAQRIQVAGYATDPAYADKLISIMRYFDGGPASPMAAPTMLAGRSYHISSG